MSSPTKNPTLFVSYYADRSISNEIVKPISISRGNPRFRINYKVEGRIPEFCPCDAAWAAESNADFRRAYIAQLNKLGIEKVQSLIDALHDETGRPLVLLCFEDLIRPDKMFCHRQVFASWYKRYTDIYVPEFSKKQEDIEVAKPRQTLSAAPEPVKITGRRRALPVASEPIKVTGRHSNLHAAPESGKVTGGRRMPSPVVSSLFNQSIYVNASDSHLKKANKSNPSKPITENRRWVMGKELLRQARERGEKLPLIFAVFEELTYWAITWDIILDDEKGTTTYQFTDLHSLQGQGYERKDLTVAKSGNKLPNSYIRSYVPVITPSFLSP